MGKVILGVLAVAALLVPGGFAFTQAIFVALGASSAVAASLALSVGFGLLGTVLSSVASLFIKKPIAGNQLTELRLNESIVPEAFRKIVFGETAAPLDVRYWETFGTDNNNFDKVIVVAGHQIESFGDFFLEDEQHTFNGSGTSNILGTDFKRFTRTLGVTGTTLSAGAGSIWTNNASLTGTAFMVLKYVFSTEKWPQGFPTRMTQVLKGALVYDPRLDSTVPGGSGTHRIDDQTTWQYNDGTTDIGRNPALQMLWYLIGWEVSGFLVCGMGVKTSSINLVEFQQAANDCESQSFESSCALSTGDEHETNIEIIESSCGGRLLDTGGVYTFKIAIDDTSSIAVTFDDNDVVGAIQWIPAKKMRDQVNIITGVYVEPGDLYQLRSFPEVSNAAFITSDGFKRRSNNRYVAVQDPLQAQKLAFIELGQTRFQGIFKAAFTYKAMQAKNWDVVTLSLASQNWVNELFRIIAYDITTKGIILLTLEQTDSSIYVTGTTTAIPIGTGNAWKPRAKVPLLGLSVTPIIIISEGQFAQDGLRVTFTAPNGMVRSSLVQYRVVGDTEWIFAGTLDGVENSLDITALGPNTSFDVRALHISIAGITGDFVTTTGTTGNGTILDLENIGGINNDDDTSGFYDNDTTITLDRGGNPISDATNNTIFDQPDEPLSASEGDIWIDRSGPIAVSKKFVNGVFVISSTEGATIGGNIVDSAGNPQGDSDLLNGQQEWNQVQDGGGTRPSDNATNNTGALADLDTVNTGQIDTNAVTGNEILDGAATFRTSQSFTAFVVAAGATQELTSLTHTVEVIDGVWGEVLIAITPYTTTGNNPTVTIFIVPSPGGSWPISSHTLPRFGLQDTILVRGKLRDVLGDMGPNFKAFITNHGTSSITVNFGEMTIYEYRK